jgi:hypothetical protein
VEGMPKTIVEGEGRVRDWVCKNTHVLIFFPPSSSKPLNKSNGVFKLFKLQSLKVDSDKKK